MPITPTYPSVYVQEIPSGVRTITGVATSIAAFVGRTQRGPVDKPVTINSFAAFERTFGGLWLKSPLSFAVRDFYLNGGSQAIIVRLFHPKFATTQDRNKALTAATEVAKAATGNDAKAAAKAATKKAEKHITEPEKSAAEVVVNAATQAAEMQDASVDKVTSAADKAIAAAVPRVKASLLADGLNLEARYEGAWGNQLRARIDYDVAGPDAANLFNLLVRDGSTGQVEILRNVSVVPGHARQVDKVLLNESQLVKMTGELPAAKPAAHPEPDPTKNETDIWADNSVATNAKVASSAAASDGGNLAINDFTGKGKEGAKAGLYALEKADLFNILCIPPYLASGDIDAPLVGSAAAYCERKKLGSHLKY